MDNFPPEIAAKLDKIVQLFGEAELDIKEVEGLQEQLVIPSINQLRYAGYHLAKAYRRNAADEEFVLAERHCKRAIFDTGESAIFFYLTYFNKFHSAYGGLEALLEFCPGYGNHLVEIDQAQSKIEQIRAQNYDSREQFYQESKDCRKSLHDIYLKLRSIQPAVERRQKEIDRKEKKSDRKFVINTLLAVLGVIAMVGSLIVAFVK